MILTKENYFSHKANTKYMSNSQYKGFVECEAQQMAKLFGQWEEPAATALLVGKYVHAWNEGRLEEFCAENPEILVKDGVLLLKYIDSLRDGDSDSFVQLNPDALTQAGIMRAGFSKAKEAFEDVKDKKISFDSFARKMTLLGDYRKADEIIEMINQSPLFLTALSGQKEVIFTANMFGCDWKILIDSYMPEEERFGDLKVLKSLFDKFWDTEAQCYQNVFEYRGYYGQMAIYADVERRANKRECYFEPFIAVATKEKFPNKDITSFVSTEQSVEDFIQSQLLMVESHMPRILAVKDGTEKPNRCGKCDYCVSTKVLTGTTHYSAYNLY